MVTIDKVEQGFSKFVDTDFIPSLNRSEVQGAVIAFGLGLATRRFRAISEHYISNPSAQMLGIVDKSGNIDIDLLRDELKKAVTRPALATPLLVLFSSTYIVFSSF